MTAILALVAIAAGAAATDRYDALIVRHAQRRHLNPRLVKAVIATESEFQPRAVSPSGARGLMQLMPDTARELGMEPRRLHEPDANLRAGTDYLALLLAERWREEGLPGSCCRDVPRGTLRRALAAYHAGPSVWRRERWPDATRAYVNKVMRFYASAASAARIPRPPRRQVPRQESQAGLPRKRPILVPGDRGEAV